MSLEYFKLRFRLGWATCFKNTSKTQKKTTLAGEHFLKSYFHLDDAAIAIAADAARASAADTDNRTRV